MNDYAKKVGSSWRKVDYPLPTEDFELQSSIMKGAIKEAMVEAFGKSNEDKVVVERDAKSATRVVCTEDANKVMLFSLTNYVTIAKDADTSGTCIGNWLDHKVYIKASTSLPVDIEKKADVRYTDKAVFVASYWLVKRVDDITEANMQVSTKEITVKGNTYAFPVLTNTRALKAGEELIMYKYSAKEQVCAKANARKGKGKGKAAKGKK